MFCISSNNAKIAVSITLIIIQSWEMTVSAILISSYRIFPEISLQNNCSYFLDSQENHHIGQFYKSCFGTYFS